MHAADTSGCSCFVQRLLSEWNGSSLSTAYPDPHEVVAKGDVESRGGDTHLRYVGREGVGTHLRYVGEGGVGTHLRYVGEGGGRYTS